MSDQLGRPHVPLLCAASQSRFVATSADNTTCAWWPICKMSHRDCNGVTKERCAVYGGNGTKTPPTAEELSYRIRLHTWNNVQLNRDCAWYPFCNSKSVVCGGRFRPLCSKYGKMALMLTRDPSRQHARISKEKGKS